LVIGAFIYTTACLGQRPSDEKAGMHFITEIIKVDSILNIPLHNFKLNIDSIRFESDRDKGDCKGMRTKKRRK
jgi:hypothetical protein